MPVKLLPITLYAALAVQLLAGCGSATSSAPAFPQSRDRGVPLRSASSCPCIYVANAAYNPDVYSVAVFPIGAKGNVAPIQTISGSKTGLIEPNDVSVDSSRNIYVSNGAETLTVYAAGANGNATPLRTIAGKKTLLLNDGPPKGIAVDPSSEASYVTLYTGVIAVYAPAAKGNVKPIETIAGKKTGLRLPMKLTFDSSGNAYVPDETGEVFVYAAGAFGDVAPKEIIYGAKTGLDTPEQIAVDGSGNIYVANYESGYGKAGSVTVYAATASGDQAPIRTISGKNTQITNPSGIALDASGNIYVSCGAILVFAANANGDVKPIREISGSKTGLRGPTGIAIQ